MPPRRSTRTRVPALKAAGIARTVDLTRSSPTPPPASASASASRPAKRARREALEEDDRDLGADEALARSLQGEEDKLARAECEANDAGPGPSTVTSTARRSSPRKRRPSPASIPAPDLGTVDPADPKTLLREWRETVREGWGTCGGCGGEVRPVKGGEAGTLPLHPTDTPLSAFLARTTTTCPACAKKLCKGCWAPLCADEGREEGRCCAEGRAMALFEVLAALDDVYLKDHLARPSALSSAPKKKSRAKKARPSGSGAGTGYGTGSVPYPSYGAGMGTGYAYDDSYGEEEEDEDWWGAQDLGNSEAEERAEVAWERRQAEKLKAAQESKAAQAAELAAKPTMKAHDVAQDALYVVALHHVSTLLPQPDAPSAQIYDFLPSTTLPPLIELSTLPDLLATLLRNDSVPEWVARAEVYFAMLDVLRALGACEPLLPALFAPRREKKWSEGIGRWVRGEGDVRWERKSAPEDSVPAAGKGKGKGRASKKRKAEEDVEGTGEVVLSAPLYTLAKKLTIQAEAFRRAAMAGAFEDSDVSLLGICGDFATAGERFKALEAVWAERQPASLNVPKDKGKGKGKGKAREWTRQEYDKACAELAYAAVELGAADGGADGGKTFPAHHYNRDIMAIATSRRPHASFVHLAKELAVIATSLPPGIWVRVDESRIDVIKCLIAGPEDSPYAGGLFEFDIFLPLQYPQVSPLCWLKTTGGGTCRFNPNLYAEGKVCLSLLGTWSGAPEEMWQPGKSTLLQVLLSITSMILGTNYPFYNEPGFGATRDDERNKNYNKNCSLATTRWAILDWLQGDKLQTSIWADVVTSHFLLRRRTISATLADWSSVDARMKAWSPVYNATAGTQNLEPYCPPVYAQGYNSYGLVANANPSANGKGKGKGKAAQKDLPPPAPAGPPPRDLVREVEEALDRLEESREKGWLEGLVA